MEYGTACEPHAVATLINNVLPTTEEFAGLVYVEEGMIMIV